MSAMSQLVYVGMHGHVLALDRATGTERWRTRLKRSGFVHVTGGAERLLAACAGEVFMLDPYTGTVLWQNRMKGLGTGLVSLVDPAAPGAGIVPVAESGRRAAANAAAAG